MNHDFLPLPGGPPAVGESDCQVCLMPKSNWRHAVMPVVSEPFVGSDGAWVIQIDTDITTTNSRVRVALNDALLYDGDPEADQPPGRHIQPTEE